MVALGLRTCVVDVLRCYRDSWGVTSLATRCHPCGCFVARGKGFSPTGKMKQRTTYLISSAEATHPDNFVIEPTRLQIKSLHGAREDRFTIGYDELPTGVRDALRQCSEIVVRWSTGKIYAAVDPFGSRVPAGLHIYASPSREVVPHVFTVAGWVAPC